MKKNYFRISLRVFYWVVFIAGCQLPVADCFSQVSPPNGINYQAVARDVSGTPLSNQTVTVTFRIRQGSAAGISVYRGTQNYPTNPFGLFNAVVGQTASDSGAFAGIPWASNIFSAGDRERKPHGRHPAPDRSVCFSFFYCR